MEGPVAVRREPLPSSAASSPVTQPPVCFLFDTTFRQKTNPEAARLSRCPFRTDSEKNA